MHSVTKNKLIWGGGGVGAGRRGGLYYCSVSIYITVCVCLYTMMTTAVTRPVSRSRSTMYSKGGTICTGWLRGHRPRDGVELRTGEGRGQ